MGEKNSEAELELEEFVSLAEGPVQELIDFVMQNNPSQKDLKRLLRAEKAGKNRKTAVEFLEKTINSASNNPKIVEEQEIGTLKVGRTSDNRTEFIVEIEGFDFELDRIPFLNLTSQGLEVNSPAHAGYTHGVSYPGIETQNTNNTDRQAVIPGTDGSQADTSNLSTKDEPNGKEPDKKSTSPQEVEEKESEETESDEDVEEAINEIMEGEKEKLKKELSEIYGLDREELEDKDISELKELKSEMHSREEKKEDLRDRFDVDEEKLEGKDLEELRELEKELEELDDRRQEVLEKYDISEKEIEDKNLEELREFEEELREREEKRKDIADKYDVEMEKLEGKDKEELEEFKDKLDKNKKLSAELGQYGYDEEELGDKDVEELHEMIDEIKEKKELMDEIGVDMEDSKLADITLEQLEELKQEKSMREKMIEELKDHGVNEQMLRNSSKEDLKKLKEEIESRDKEDPESSESDEEQTEEEIKEEAEEDLEMLMGAVQEDEEQGLEEETDSFMEYFDLKNEFKKRWSNLKNTSRKEREEKKVRYEKVVGLLESYRNMKPKEGSIKTAQILKGYLEHLLNIQREMTYRELSESLEELDRDEEEIETLINFFDSMEDEYSGDITLTDLDSVIDSAEIVIDELR